MSRDNTRRLGKETLQILQAGRYRAPSGQTVELADDLRRAVEGTCDYPPVGQAFQPDASSECQAGKPDLRMHIEVVNRSTLAAARQLFDEGHRPVALNFASAKNPGGGWLGGARAQEESLARASGLVACIDGNPMYAFHRARADCLYTSYAIYSPDVPVIRDDEGILLERPWPCAFITCPAVNAKVVLQRDPRRGRAVQAAMRERIDKVLAIAVHHGHDAVILGAWGCGVFGNDGEEIAGLFRQALGRRFHGAFARVVFAVLDWSEDRRFIGPFERAFATSAG